MVLELRPAHNPTRAYGFASVVLSLKDLSSSIWLWYKEGATGGKGGKGGKEAGGEWKVKKVIDIPAEPADPKDLPPLLQGFKAVPPLITDINLSLDELLTNTISYGFEDGERHAIDIVLEAAGDSATVTIRDDAPSERRRRSIEVLEERARTLGAVISVDHDDRGSTMRLVLPMYDVSE